MSLLRIAWQGVVGFRLRTLLAVVALTASVVGVVSVAAASSTVQATVLQRALLQNGPEVTVDVTGLTGSPGLESSESLSTQLLNSFGQTTDVARVANLESVLLVTETESRDVHIDFADSALISIRPFPILEGRWLDMSDAGAVALDLVMNEQGADELGVGLGNTLRMVSLGVETPVLVRVVGIVDDGSTAMNAYIGIDAATNFLILNSQHLSVSIKLAGGVVDRDAVKNLLGRWEQWNPTSAELEVQRKDTVGTMKAEVEATRATFVTVGLIGLLASISAIANIGLSTLRERGSELSLRRALGARRWHVPIVMILESQVVALIAATIAVPLSWVLYPAIVSQFGAPFGIAPPPYPWEFAVLGLAVGMLTSLIGSLAPAIFALQVRIANVMRE